MNRAIMAVLCLLLISLTSCGYGDIEYVKDKSIETWKSNRFQVIGYQGYQIGTIIPFTTYGGALVWYTVEKVDQKGVIFQGALKRWGDEIHIYNLESIDAIKGN